jgi:hypothetical protein
VEHDNTVTSLVAVRAGLNPGIVVALVMALIAPYPCLTVNLVGDLDRRHTGNGFLDTPRQIII